ncbi:hypothetical protein [Humibacter sp.]|uniref:hypothetical protein n=1 Tax=Humibacter sp. TaxID=1940291 RepID=UPI003F7DD5C5
MRIEERDLIERGPTADELAEEIRLYELWQQKQEEDAEMHRHTVRWRFRYLSTSDEPKVA